ncbi:hypothetical protein N3K66_003463 [Trichothecium roseum]|uniref:Uncharacterized protein n=1 Tax=Trichothecium roseum TaxID=47278 RepID=A0ACC0V5G9_9HYPO|nr:hypothetical protein N3K66_003463 [Trichothecium roseum]
MSYHTRSLSQVRGPGGSSSSSAAHSPALVARIEEKKAELENLRELQQLSAAVASQMEALEKELSTLSDGTQAIAAVVGNWHNVLRAINMASSKLAKTAAPADGSEKDALPQTLGLVDKQVDSTLGNQEYAACDEGEGCWLANMRSIRRHQGH